MGQNVLRHEEAWQKLWRVTRFMGHTGYVISAFSAIDMALWDLKAKALGVPVAHLLGGYRDEVPVYASHKLFRQWNLKELQKDAHDLVQKGFTVLRFDFTGLGQTLQRQSEKRHNCRCQSKNFTRQSPVHWPCSCRKSTREIPYSA